MLARRVEIAAWELLVLRATSCLACLLTMIEITR